MTGVLRSAESADVATGQGRPRRAVVVWAVVGVLWLVVCGRALAGWVTSPEFSPAPVLGPDTLPGHSLVALRVLEVLSVTVLAICAWFLVVKPWRRGRLGLDAFLMLGGVFGFVADASLNLYTYLFAWNAHSVNLGVWGRWMPFHHPGAATRYAEALLWGLPMYVYFCAGLGYVGVRAAVALRRRFPHVSTASLLALLGVGDFVFDLVVENVIIRTTDAYAFARTQGGLTLWAGSQYQFPLYESVAVAFVSLAFTAVRLSAVDAPDGLSFIERGAEHLPRVLRLPARALAGVGFCAVVLVMLYHLPFNWLGITGDSMAHLPSYMLPG
ncbi:spirocyclase AveC family protein [Amycolatopsis sp. K13G38]|uniref:Spirocyclase AveC family protein n=1 Tax=Amycolatopsis acididurans TaxID=2724524 RepID=A0ABX1J358_9PSEU|nr:spirocyclase AveC family protein [Amycolatopsis acididurans]NKQ54237.1 spirocyclase AveC family protein [Amycolatopsis acididurans]